MDAQRMNLMYIQQARFQKWQAMVKGIEIGTIEQRVQLAERISRSTRSKDQCRALWEKLKYFEIAVRVLQKFAASHADKTPQSPWTNQMWIQFIGFIIKTLARILFVVPAASRPSVLKRQELLNVTKFILWLFAMHQAMDIKFTSAQFIWMLTYKTEENGKRLCDSKELAEKFRPVDMLVKLLSGRTPPIRMMAAGALWGLCGNRGSNSVAQRTIGESQESLKKLLEVLIDAEQNIKGPQNDARVKESFIVLGALTALCDVKAPQNAKKIVELGAPKVIVKILVKCAKEYEQWNAQLSALRISKCLELLGKLLLITSKARRDVLGLQGEVFITNMLKCADYEVRNAAAITIIQATIVADSTTKERFGTHETFKLLIDNIQESKSAEVERVELQYTSALALAALSYMGSASKLPSTATQELKEAHKQEQDNYRKVVNRNQTMILKIMDGVTLIKTFLKPMANKDLLMSLRVLPIKVGLRLLTNLTWENPEVQDMMLKQMMHSICCNNILAKDYGYEVDKAAIEFLASMCRKNKKAQDQLSKHNVNHFILGRIVKRAKERPKSHKRLIQTCGHMLYCLAENNSTVKAGILGLMKTYSCTPIFEDYYNHVAQAHQALQRRIQLEKKLRRIQVSARQ